MDDITDIVSDESRRSLLKKGALATAGAGLVGTADAVAAGEDGAGDDGPDGDGGGSGEALVHVSQARPASRFVVTSPVLDWQPSVPGIPDDVWAAYDARVVRYLNTGERVLCWQASEATLPPYDLQAGHVVDAGDATGDGRPRPAVFRFDAEPSRFRDAAYLAVEFVRVAGPAADDALAGEAYCAGGGTAGTAGD